MAPRRPGPLRDGTDQEPLASEHFANNDAFVALTGRDEDNLISALYAQQRGHPQSGGQVQPDELRCRGPGRRPGVRGGPQAHHRSPHPPAGPGLENKEGGVMSALYRLADTDAEAAEFILQENTPPLRVPLKDLSIRKGFLIVALLHENHVVIPPAPRCCLRETV